MRAKRDNSDMFTVFEQSQLQEFKEVSSNAYPVDINMFRIISH